MVTDATNPRPEREQTDDSLRTERDRTDRALSEKQAVVEEDADLVVQRAREQADAVVTAARELADQPSSGACDQTVAATRALEDQALQDERDAADESLRNERQNSALALSRLLPFERDKTDRHLLTERERSDLALANRDDFLGMVSHDLRNLLGGIVLSADVLTEHSPPGATGEKTRTGTARIRRYAARMNRLIGDLVDVASIDAGKLAMTPAPGDASKLIAEAVETFRTAAASKGVGLEAEHLDRSLPARFDHDRMLQVLANLIANALKFTGQGGRIWVHVERDPVAGLRFCVGDTGSGIPESMLEAVFQRFWQVGKDDRRGLGLGLYISRCIVDAHGGKIWAESVPGEGSRFTFTVPIAGPSVAPAETAPGA